MLDSFPISLLVGTILGFLTGLGIGGGSLLILWMTMVLKIPQETARVINLLFFLPAALISTLLRARRGSLEIRRVLPAILAGSLSAMVFTWAGFSLDTGSLRKAFGILLIAVGLRELRYRPR